MDENIYVIHQNIYIHFSANKVVKTYVNGFLDCSGYLLNRVGNVMIGNVDYPGYNINQRSLLVNGRTQMNGNLTINGNISVNSTRIALGLNAAAGTVGTNTVAIGTQAGQTNLGSESVAIGYLTSATRLGSQSTAVGSYAGYNQTGTYNTFFGREAGYFSGSQMTGGNNTYVGYNTSANSSGYSNSTAIGTGAIITATNQIVLGTTNETVVIPGATTATGLITANGGLTTGTINSSGTTFNLATATATTLNLGSASTTVSIPGSLSAAGITASSLITANGGLTMGGSKNITLGDGTVTPVVGQIGWMYSMNVSGITVGGTEINVIVSPSNMQKGVYIITFSFGFLGGPTGSPLGLYCYMYTNPGIGVTKVASYSSGGYSGIYYPNCNGTYIFNNTITNNSIIINGQCVSGSISNATGYLHYIRIA